MNRILNTLTLILLIFLAEKSYAQKKSTLFLQGQYYGTISDLTKGNNPWGAGIGMQFYLLPQAKIQPLVEFSTIAYVANDKILRLDENENILEDFRGSTNLFAGLAYNHNGKFYIALIAGPSLVGKQLRPALKPEAGFYFTTNKRWKAAVSYLNVFNRGTTQKRNFESLGLAIGFRLY